MVRIVKRSDLGRARSIAIRLAAVIGALLASAVFIGILGHNPLAVYISMIEGALGNINRLKETIVKTIPLVVTSLGISVAFRMKFWNIGGEGQITIGACFASYFALYFHQWPKPVLLTVMILAGMIGGGLWALIPAAFKAYFGTNETLFTLMLNYIAIKWVTFLQFGPWKDKSSFGFPKIPNFENNAIMPKVLGIHFGWIIALVLIVAMYIFIHHTKRGYEINVVGESENTARYAGINIKKIIISSIFLSGALCGLAGMMQASGVNNTLTMQVAGGTGFTAIITTWLSGLSAPLILVVSFLFSVMVQGGAFIQTAFQIPQSAAQLLQGMILFFVLGSEFFIQYKLVPDRLFQWFGKTKEGM